MNDKKEDMNNPTHCDKIVDKIAVGGGVYRFQCKICGLVVWGTGANAYIE